MTDQPPQSAPQPGSWDAAAVAMYEDLRRVAGLMFAQERASHTLQPTAVVNEACLRMAAHPLPDLPRSEQLAMAGRVLRQVLVDHARARDAEKRGGGQLRLQLNEDLGRDTETVLEFGPLHEAIEKLRGRNQRHAEVVLLRVFSGMTMDDIANHLGVSKRTVEADWTFARVWLRRELAGPLGLEGSAP